MAMTKAERAELDGLRSRDAALRSRDAALRSIGYPQFPRPEPMPACKSGEVQSGWTFNVRIAVDAYAHRNDAVCPAWRNSLYSYDFDPRERKAAFGAGSQSGINLYRTEAEANRALAYEVADRFGGIMARIYAKCF